jgi:hypothetical protein
VSMNMVSRMYVLASDVWKFPLARRSSPT